MASINLDKLSVKELLDLEVKVRKAIETAKSRQRDAVKQKIDQLVAREGFSADELAEIYGFARGRGGRKGTKVAPKYRNPDNKLETWTGRGRQPRWVAARLAKGAKLADFVI
ncbi:MAG TPA: H-NS histone family protein [Hyphomicrobiaceae bacterium]|nr:H-NS histone family protein [Hyphomicrobiaceae bacterium]